MRKWIDSSLLLFLLLYSCLSIALGANHYIRVGATGNNDGSDWTNAWTGISQVTWTRGDTYYVADGTYTDANNLDGNESGTSVITVKKATESEHGSATGWSSAYGDGVATFNEVFLFTEPYYVVDGVTGGGPGSWKTGHGFVVDQSELLGRNCVSITQNLTEAEEGHITVRHVECIGNGGDLTAGNTQDGFGSYRYFHTDILFEYNYIHDVGRVFIFLRGNDITVQYNWMARNESSSNQHSEGMQVSGGTDTANLQPQNIDIRYNVFEDVEGTAVISMWAHDIRIYGNVVFQTSTFNSHTHNDGLGGTYFHNAGQNGNGVFSGGAGTGSSAKIYDVKIFNNTILDFGGNRASLLNASGVLTGNEAFNNLWYNCNQIGIDGNKIAHNYNYFIDSQIVSEVNGQSGTGDPFTDRANQDFTLTLISVTNAGLTLADIFNTDPAGVTRGADGNWDRGAYEVTASQPSPPRNLRVTQSSP